MACDQVLVAGPAWLGGIGVDIRSNGVDTGTVLSCRSDSTNLTGDLPQWGAGWQCVELVNRLYLSRGWITATWAGNAGDLYNTAPSNLVKELQGSIKGLSLGDVVVFGNDIPPAYGHVAVVGQINGSTIQLYSQNALSTSPIWTGTLSAGTLTVPGLGDGLQIVGVVHAPYRGMGYWMLDTDGEVFGFGAALYTGQPTLNRGRRAVKLVATPDGGGYWVVDDAGKVYPSGTAPNLGSVPAGWLHGGETVASLLATPSGRGYWLFTSAGRVYRAGDAPALGDMAGHKLAGAVLDSKPTPSGRGYYMVASDGGIFSFGDAVFYGSMGGRPLNMPVRSLVPTATGHGYWLVASDGGIFAFGDAHFLGSMGGKSLNRPVVGMVRFGAGYLMVASDGGIFNYSDRPFLGSLAADPPATPIVAVSALAA